MSNSAISWQPDTVDEMMMMMRMRMMIMSALYWINTLG
jgi:hypothetical protein